MLLLEAMITGSLNLLTIDQEKRSDEINQRMLAIQAIVNAKRTGYWDNGTLSAIENGLVAYGIAGSYNITPEQLTILYDRELIGRESGYWLEATGLSDGIYNTFLILIFLLRSIDVSSSSSSVGQGTGSSTGGTKSEYTRVGRWMSESEYKKMVETGKVQMSPNGNAASVANPADPAAFINQAKPGSIYVEFDVPTYTIQPGGKDSWGLISGPGSLWDRFFQSKGLSPISEMPDAQNIQIIGGK